MGAKQLGEHLQGVRHLKNKSLKKVAGDADISPAYLLKLENGDVEAPSPHKLYSLSEALELPYPELMQLAGYAVPQAPDPKKAPVNVLAQALLSEDLNESELRDLASYLRWRRQQAAEDSDDS